MKSIVEKLLENLTSNNYMVRKYAIQSLEIAETPPRLSKKILEALIHSLNDSNGEVRKRALLTLEALINQKKVNIQIFKDHLIKEVSDILGHRDPEVRSNAINIMTILTILDTTNGKVHGAALIARITGMLDDANPNVRLAALSSIAALAKAGAPIQTSVDNIIRYILQEESKYFENIRAKGSVDDMETVRKRRKKMLSFFNEMVDSSDQNGLRTAFIMGLHQLLDDPDGKDVDVIIGLIRNLYEVTDVKFSEENRMEIVKKLIYFGMHTKNERVETGAAKALQVVFKKEGLDSPISQRFFLPAPEVKEEENLFKIALNVTLETQQSFWGAKFIGVIFEKWDIPEEVIHYIRERLQDAFLCIYSITVIREIGRTNRAFAESLYPDIFDLTGPDKRDRVRQEATKTLGRLLVGEECLAKSVQRLLEMIKERNDELNVIVARSLERLNRQDPSIQRRATQVLLELAMKDTGNCRIFAEVLGVFYSLDSKIRQESLDQLFAGLEHPGNMVRENALWLINILAKKNSPLDFTPSLGQIYSIYEETKDPFLKRELIQTLLSLFQHKSIQEHRTDILDILITVLEDPHLLVSEAASLSLSSLFHERV